MRTKGKAEAIQSDLDVTTTPIRGGHTRQDPKRTGVSYGQWSPAPPGFPDMDICTSVCLLTGVK
jgi:hypothetical protein